MKIIEVNPIEVKSFIRNYNYIYLNRILVGKCHEDNYCLSELIFPPILKNSNEIITKAVLKLYCKNGFGQQKNINVCVNNDDLYLDVSEIGNYEWDVTSVLKFCKDSYLKFCIYPKDYIICCGIKEFEALDDKLCPVLELIVDNKIPDPDDKIFNNVKVYKSTKSLKHSEWIDCICLDSYYYFIENLGINDVEIFIDVSPDKKIVFQDSGPFNIKGNGTLYLQPMRESRFIRISYKNSLSNHMNLIKVWLQGKK